MSRNLVFIYPQMNAKNRKKKQKTEKAIAPKVH